ncbi:MAG: amidohydrolase family protein [Acidobacteria bacterium]|nr:amidohydrolase family protein [Acidobacteriota bacterium]
MIKVSASESLTVGELAAVVEEAHRQHLKVAVHAIETASIQTAIDAGADSIEHGNFVTDDQLAPEGHFLRSDGDFLWRLLSEDHRAQYRDVGRYAC